MGTRIVRLFALDWEQTLAALHEKGEDFFWLARDTLDDDIDMSRIPFVEKFDGALADMAGWRDPTANDIYDGLREHLEAEARHACDLAFSYLFWDHDPFVEAREEIARLRDLAIPEGSPARDVWSGLAPSTVRDALGHLQRIRWGALYAVADRYTHWEERFLPTMDDFESHVGCHKEFLEEALKRNAGVVSLSSF